MEMQIRKPSTHLQELKDACFWDFMVYLQYQGLIQNPVKHLRWSVLRKWLIAFNR